MNNTTILRWTIQSPTYHHPLMISPESVEVLKLTMRELSRSSLASHSATTDLVVEALTNPLPVYAHWMALMMVAGKDIRVTLKSHFTTSDVQKMAAKIYNSSKIEAEKVESFVKEFCNLTLGGFKVFLEQNNLVVGTSLPLITRGFDNVFFPAPVGKMSYQDSWRLRSRDAVLDCTVTFEIFHEFVIKPLDASFGESAGEAEFF